MKVRHYIKLSVGPGGMPSLLRGHLQRLPGEECVGILDGLPGGGADTRIGVLQENTGAKAVAIYHNGWGIEWLAGCDGAARRLLFLHSDFPRLKPWLRHCSRWCDGFLTNHPGLTQLACEALGPGWRGRVETLPLPAVGMEAPPAVSERPPVIGFCARLERRQKRVDRLPDFWRRLHACMPDARLEIAGTGPSEGWLRGRFEGDPSVRFLGWVEAERMPEVMGGWRHLLVTSDFEGACLSLLEAMAAGVVPVYPALRHERGFLDRIDPAFLYPAGDVGAAIGRIISWASDSSRYRRAAQAAAEAGRARTWDHYTGAWAEALGRLGTLPPRPTRSDVSSGVWTRLPVWAYNRLHRWRSHGLA